MVLIFTEYGIKKVLFLDLPELYKPCLRKKGIAKVSNTKMLLSDWQRSVVPKIYLLMPVRPVNIFS